MIELPPIHLKHFDRFTGEEIVEVTRVFLCPDYQEGYSDHEWHSHDRYTEKEK